MNKIIVLLSLISVFCFYMSIVFKPIDIGTISKAEVNKLQPQETSVPLTEEEKKQLYADYQQWSKARGYFTKEDHSKYATLSAGDLNELAKEGDLLALDIQLKDPNQKRSKEEHIKLSYHAASYGSTAALNYLVSRYSLAAKRDSNSIERRKADLKYALMYAEISARRGDKKGLWIALRLLNSGDVDDIELTHDDFKETYRLARGLYKSLAYRRAEYGLGKFDNTIDPHHRESMALRISQLENKHGWAKRLIAAR